MAYFILEKLKSHGKGGCPKSTVILDKCSFCAPPYFVLLGVSVGPDTTIADPMQKNPLIPSCIVIVSTIY